MSAADYRCPNHPAAAATRWCVQCGAETCEACTVARTFGTHTRMEVCGKCGGLVRTRDPLAIAREAGDAGAVRALGGAPFYLRPLDLLAFPLRGPHALAVLVFFAGLQTLLLGFGRHSPYGLLGFAVFHGLLFSTASYVVRRVDLGDERLTSGAEFESAWDDVYAPALRANWAQLPMLIALGVAIANRGVDQSLHAALKQPIPLALLTYGLLMLPGALLQAATQGSALQILNPVAHVRVLAHSPREYLFALAYTLAFVALYIALRRLYMGPLLLLEAVDGFVHAYVALALARLYGLLLRGLTR